MEAQSTLFPTTATPGPFRSTDTELSSTTYTPELDTTTDPERSARRSHGNQPERRSDHFSAPDSSMAEGDAELVRHLSADIRNEEEIERERRKRIKKAKKRIRRSEEVLQKWDKKRPQTHSDKDAQEPDESSSEPGTERTDLEEFLLKFEECGEHFQWSDADRGLFLRGAIKGYASYILRAISQSDRGGELWRKIRNSKISEEDDVRRSRIYDLYVKLCHLRCEEMKIHVSPDEGHYLRLFIDGLEEQAAREEVIQSRSKNIEEALYYACSASASVPTPGTAVKDFHRKEINRNTDDDHRSIRLNGTPATGSHQDAHRYTTQTSQTRNVEDRSDDPEPPDDPSSDTEIPSENEENIALRDQMTQLVSRYAHHDESSITTTNHCFRFISTLGRKVDNI